MRDIQLPSHGGNLSWASKTFHVDLAKWLDVSTGMSPWAWPIPSLPSDVYQHASISLDASLSSAAGYFGCDRDFLHFVPGSQFVTAALPQVLDPGRVALPRYGNQDHLPSWCRAGHRPVYYRNLAQAIRLCHSGMVDYAVVLHPNTLTAEYASHQQLHELEAALASARPANHKLVVDEGFIDVNPAASYIGKNLGHQTIVLRSIAPFFGLTGVRLGVVYCHPDGLALFSAGEPLWQVDGPAHFIARAALRDTAWIEQQQLRITEQSRQLANLLPSRFPDSQHRHAGLFHTLAGHPEKLMAVFTRLAKRGILTRFVPGNGDKGYLRFGLPGRHFSRFARAI